MRPDFVIIGAQKAGSTGLMGSLQRHPEVVMPPGETRYFRDPWFQFEDESVLEFEETQQNLGARRRGIKCPDLLGMPEAPIRLRDALGPVELVAVLRHPVDRAISSYYWLMQWGLLPLMHPEEGLSAILEGTLQREHPRGAEVLSYGLYGEHLANYARHFPRDKLFVLLVEDIRADADEAFRGLTSFLGIPPTLVEAPRRKSNPGVYSMSRLRFLSRRHPLLLREYPGYPGKFLQSPATRRDWVVDRGVAAIDRLVLARVMDNSPPAISVELRRRLAAYYAEDILRTAEFLGRPLDHWLA